MIHPLSFAALLLLSAAPALAADRSFPVGGFDKIRLSGSTDVEVSTGKQVSVRATGDQVDLDRLDISVSGGELVIAEKRGNWSMGWNSNSAKVFVTVPGLVAASLPGSGNLRIDRVKGPAFDGLLNGSGDLILADMASDVVRFTLKGSGDISSAGTCGSATLELHGSGNISAGNLRCRTVSATLKGSGDISAFATKSADLVLQGSGDIALRGGAVCTKTARGSGDISCS